MKNLFLFLIDIYTYDQTCILKLWQDSLSRHPAQSFKKPSLTIQLHQSHHPVRACMDKLRSREPKKLARKSMEGCGKSWEHVLSDSGHITCLLHVHYCRLWRVTIYYSLLRFAMVFMHYHAPIAVYCGLAWHGMAGHREWHGMAWHDMAWHGMPWQGMAWYGVTWHRMAWLGMARRGMAWHGMA